MTSTLAKRDELISELEAVQAEFKQAIDIAIGGTTDQKLAVVNSLQSYTNRIKHIEDQIFAYAQGQKVWAFWGTVRRDSRSGVITDRFIGNMEFINAAGVITDRNLVRGREIYTLKTKNGQFIDVVLVGGVDLMPFFDE
jgi:hypothetical protein